MSLSKSKAGSGIMSEDVRRHNEDILSKCKEGDMLEFPRPAGYSHWGVYVGTDADKKVIHLTSVQEGDKICCGPGSLIGANTGLIKEESFWKVAGTSKAKINNYKDGPKSPEEIVERARRHEGKLIKYDMFGVKGYQCEMFATWCRYGKGTSRQVQKASLISMVCGGAVGIVGVVVLAWLLLSLRSNKTP